MAASDDEWIRVGDPIPLLSSFEPLEGRKARLRWRDGRDVVIDLMPALIRHRGFAKVLKDDALFRSGTVEFEWGNCIHWTGDDDLSAVWIERLGQEQGVM